MQRSSSTLRVAKHNGTVSSFAAPNLPHLVRTHENFRGYLSRKQLGNHQALIFYDLKELFFHLVKSSMEEITSVRLHSDLIDTVPVPKATAVQRLQMP